MRKLFFPVLLALLFSCSSSPETVSLEDFGAKLTKANETSGRQACIVFSHEACKSCLTALCTFLKEEDLQDNIHVFSFGFKSEKNLKYALGADCYEALKPVNSPEFPKDVPPYDYGNTYLWLLEGAETKQFTELSPQMLENEFKEIKKFLRGNG